MNPPLNLTLYRRVRSAFVEAGSSLNEWCRSRGLYLTTAKSALTGYSQTAEAKALRAIILETTGIDDDPT